VENSNMSAETSTAIGPSGGPFDFNALVDAAERGEIDGVAANDLKGGADSTPEVLETPKPAAEAPAAAEAATEVGTEGAAILTADGKHTIPARELTETRRRNAELRQEKAALESKVNELSQQFGDLNARYEAAAKRMEAAPAGSMAAANATAELGDLQAELAAIDAGMATVGGEAAWLNEALTPQAKALKAAVSAISKLTTMVDELKADRATEAQRQAAAVQQTVEEAIAANEVLASWRDADGLAWQEARDQDNLLRNRPEWVNKPFAERFAEVQKRVVGVLGQEVVPEHLREVAKPEGKKDDLSGLDRTKVIAAGKAKLKDAKPGIQTLSDLPGGTPAAASIATELAEDAVSVARLEQYYANKSIDDITAIFRT
jgi:hypothetical protein